MKKIIGLILLICSLAIASGTGSIILESGYVKVGVSEDGTFGVGGSLSPGILYDENGTGNYGVDDYLTPGDPFEFFTLEMEIIGDKNVTYINNNDDYMNPEMPTVISGDSHMVITESKTPDDLLKLTQTYTLEEGSKILRIDVEVENISASTINVKYARGLDPDVDANTYGIYETNNTRGYDGSADGLPVFPVEDVVIAEGERTKKIIALLYIGEYSHNTSIDSDWDTLPSNILGGKDDGIGDNTINLAVDLGTMTPGDIKEFSVAYISSNDLSDLSGVLPLAAPPTASTYTRNDNPNTPQHGSAPAFNIGSLLILFLLFGLLFYRNTVSRRS